MNLTKIVIKRPVSAMLAIIAIIIFGLSAVFSIQLEYFPDLEMPMELVYVLYPGADADSVQRLVTKPIEEAGKSLTGINNISSTSYRNYATIQFTYEYDTDLNDAYMELRAALDNLADDLPENCHTPTIMEISLDSEATITAAAKATEGFDLMGYVNDVVTPRLETVNGVAQVEVTGGQDKYVRIVLNSEKMDQYGLSIGDIAGFIASAKSDVPAGSVTTGSMEESVSVVTEVEWQQDLPNIVLKTGAGDLVRLTDVANIVGLYKSDAESFNRYNGRDSILIDVTKKSSGATISVCNEVEGILDQLTMDGVEFEVIHSSKDDILDTLMEVLKTLVEGVLFTMLVLYIFFGDLRASLIVGSSMPLSLLATMLLLNFMGISFDLMTGTGLIIAIGMIVDNSIVVMESCFRMKTTHADFKEAAIQGTSTVMTSIIASTLTTVVVYLPIAMTSGMSGQMNQPLSYSIVFTMLASLISSIAVVPLFFSKIQPVAKENLPINRLLEKLNRAYDRIIRILLHHRILTIFTAVLLFAGSLALAAQLPLDLFPSSYDGSIEVEANFRSGTKLEVMNQKVQSIEQELIKDINFDSVALNLSGNTASIVAYSAEDCKRSSKDAVEYYTSLFGNMVDMDISVIPKGTVSGLASLMSTGNNVKITLLGTDLDRLKDGAQMVEESIKTIPGIMKVTSDTDQNETTAKIVVDPLRAMDAGLTPTAVSADIYYTLSGMTAATLEQGDEEYEVKLVYEEGKYDDISSLLDKTITTGKGRMVTLGELSDVKHTNILRSISRQDGKFLATVTATTTSTAKYTATQAINGAVNKIQFPEGVAIGQSASDKTLAKEALGLGKSLIAAVFLVFLVMAMQFESVKFSIMVMTCIPFSLIGSFLLLFISGSPLSMMAMMGFLMLIGMVVNNGILLVDATNELRKTISLEEALIQAGTTRLRPILMTTLTTVLSMLPLVLSGDSGMAMMRGMGFVIIGGLCASTILAMFMMPPFYLVISGERLDGEPKINRKHDTKI